MPFNISEVYNGTRALLNDQDGAVFTNTVQFEYLKMAYEELRQELEENNIPVSNRSAEFTITAGIVDIGGNTGPALPLDIIEPQELFERTSGTNDNYIPMTRSIYLPKTEVLTSYLRVWAYQNQIIKFLSSTSDIQVKMDYVGDPLANLVNENTQVRVRNTVNYLKYKNAALCSMFVGENETRAEVLNNQAIIARDALLNISVKSSQSMVTRRRPFGTNGINAG